MSRWILLLVSMVAFGVAFRTDSPGLLAATLLVGLVALVGGFLGFVSARVDSVAQGQSSREFELLLSSKKRVASKGDGGSSIFVSASAGDSSRKPDSDANDGSGGGSDGGGGDGGGGGGGD